MQYYIKRRTDDGMPVRPGYSSHETQKAYNLIMDFDGGRAASKMSSIEQMLSHYSASLAPVIAYPDNPATDEMNKDNINDMDSVDWMEILISCHHMHGYRLDGTPLGINFLPEDFHS